MLTHKKCHKKHSYIFLSIKFWSYIIKKETTAQQERIKKKYNSGHNNELFTEYVM